MEGLLRRRAGETPPAPGFERWLPHELLWRERAQFGDGSGAAGVLTNAIQSTVSEDEFAAESAWSIVPDLMEPAGDDRHGVAA